MANQPLFPNGLANMTNREMLNSVPDMPSFPSVGGQPLAADLEAAIAGVTIDQLADLRDNTNLITRIVNNLPQEGNRFVHTAFSDFFIIYLEDRRVGDRDSFRTSFRERISVTWPGDIQQHLLAAPDQDTRSTLEDRYTAQAFLRSVLNELVRRNPVVARDLVANLAGNPPANPSLGNAPVPPMPRQPQLAAPQQNPVGSGLAATQPAAGASSKSNKRYYCPSCGQKREKWNDLHKHWFESHRRSSRSAAWLKEQMNDGKLGPWTGQEAKQKGKDMKGVAESEADKTKRWGLEQEAPTWRDRMRSNPEKWEKQAQEDEGYSPWDKSFTDFSRQKIHATKQRKTKSEDNLKRRRTDDNDEGDDDDEKKGKENKKSKKDKK